MRTPFEIHAHYSKLFEAFGKLPLQDIKVALNLEESRFLLKANYYGLRNHFSRLKTYLNETPPSPERRHLIQEYIDNKGALYRHMLKCPEDRVPNAENRLDLRIRFFTLLHPKSHKKAFGWAHKLNPLHDTSIEELEKTSRLTVEEREQLPLEKVKAELLRTEVLFEYEKKVLERKYATELAKHEQARQVKRALENGYKALLPVLSAAVDYSRGEQHVCYNFVDASPFATNCVKQPDDFEPWLNNAKKPELKTYRRKLAGILAMDVTRLSALQRSFENGVYSLNDLQREFAGVEIVLPTLGQWISPAHNSVAPTFWEVLKGGLLRVLAQSEVRYNLVSEKLGKPFFTRADNTQVLTSTDAPQEPANDVTRTAREPKRAKLLPGFTVDEVRGILQETGLGNRYTQPGEWAAAFRALHVVGILTGGVTSMERWAIEEGYSGMFSQSTLKTPWRDEWNEPEDADSPAKGIVFRSIVQRGETMMKVKQLRGTNK